MCLGRRSFSRLLKVYKLKAQGKSVRNVKNNEDSGGGVGGIQQKNKYNDERGEKREQVQKAAEIQPEYSLIAQL